MGQDIKENGKSINYYNMMFLGFKGLRSGKEKECKYGLMDQCMKAGGKITRLTARVD